MKNRFNDEVMLTIRMPRYTREAFKIHCIRKGIPMNNLIMEWIIQELAESSNQKEESDPRKQPGT